MLARHMEIMQNEDKWSSIGSLSGFSNKADLQTERHCCLKDKSFSSFFCPAFSPLAENSSRKLQKCPYLGQSLLGLLRGTAVRLSDITEREGHVLKGEVAGAGRI